MNKLKFTFLLVMLLTTVTAFAGYAPANVRAALKKMYPTADDIAWSQGSGYYIADFMMDGFDTKVWFQPDGQWAMKQTDWETMDEVPAAVFNSFAASYYSGYEVQNVVWVQFPKWQPIVAVVVGLPNVQTRYLLLFTPYGEFLNERNVTFMHNILGPATFL